MPRISLHADPFESRPVGTMSRSVVIFAGGLVCMVAAGLGIWSLAADDGVKPPVAATEPDEPNRRGEAVLEKTPEVEPVHEERKPGSTGVDSLPYAEDEPGEPARPRSGAPRPTPNPDPPIDPGRPIEDFLPPAEPVPTQPPEDPAGAPPPADLPPEEAPQPADVPEQPQDPPSEMPPAEVPPAEEAPPAEAPAPESAPPPN